MRGGRLRDTIVIKRNTGDQDDNGALLGTFSTIATAKANVQVLSGAQMVQSGVSLNTEYVSILMRMNTAILHKDVVEFDGYDFSIGSLKPSNKRRDLIIMASRDI